MQTWRSYTKHTTIINHTKSCEQQDWGWKNGNIATIMITLEPGDVPCYMLLEQLQAISHRKGHDFGASEHGQLHNFMAMKAMTWCLGHELCLFCSRTLSHYRWLVPYFWRLFHIFENKTQVKFLHIYIYVCIYIYVYIYIMFNVWSGVMDRIHLVPCSAPLQVPRVIGKAGAIIKELRQAWLQRPRWPRWLWLLNGFKMFSFKSGELWISADDVDIVVWVFTLFTPKPIRSGFYPTFFPLLLLLFLRCHQSWSFW